ncbi:MAG: SagB/ThcOx family dehydrogenase [Aigarchaeota archaeon]|nr:SagB/ThcOx family dehydrogenase [Aigarchaeota archaeon]MCX8192281.1 SagB/ThcOx family dehydrogenase [Nitrososphaeria archaeon]MDW7986111.1 SagB/ThcOx family dehydrogenase [Nitrososphaerota archaeon]
MNRRTLLAYILLPTVSAVGLALIGFKPEDRRISKPMGRVVLPPPRTDSEVSVEYALRVRRSIRDYEDKPLTLQQVSQLVWAAQGITDKRYGFRTAPSAGATYPLEVYVVVKKGGVIDLEEGIYHYLYKEHVLELLKSGDYSRELMEACLDQEWVGDASINIVITAIYERTTWRYGERGRIRYVHMEVGHVGQNIYLQCVSLGLGCVVIGAFYDDSVKKILGVDEEPLYVIPVGVKKGGWL